MQYVAKKINREYSYQPIPFYQEMKQSFFTYTQKLDLNLYCIKRPKQTCFIRVNNPNLLAWGIDEGDMLVVEQCDSLSEGDLVVLNVDDQFCFYEFILYNNGEFIFFSLDSRLPTIKVKKWTDLDVIGVITNTIHQIKPKKTMRFAA